MDYEQLKKQIFDKINNDCPIKALYMMKEFGVKFLHWIYPSIHKTEMELLPVGISYLENIIPYFNHKYAFENRFIVAPESEHIFEPKNYDFGIVKNFNPLIFVRFRSHYNSWGYEGDEYYEQFNNDEVNIIYRDGKHFFNPKEEN